MTTRNKTKKAGKGSGSQQPAGNLDSFVLTEDKPAEADNVRDSEGDNMAASPCVRVSTPKENIQASEGLRYLLQKAPNPEYTEIKDIVNSFKDSMTQALGSLSQKLNQKLDSIKSELKPLQDGQAKLSQGLDELKESLQYSQQDIDELRKGQIDIVSENKELREQIAECKEAIKLRDETIVKLAERVLNLERYTHGYNIRLSGVKENDNENCKQILVNHIKKIQEFKNWDINQLKSEVENAHRTGKKKTGMERHIIARLHNRPFKNSVLRLSKNSDLGEGVRFIEDLPFEDLQLKIQAMDQMKEAYNDNKKVRFTRGKLYINDRAVAIQPKENKQENGDG